jgi:hypothetical protein
MDGFISKWVNPYYLNILHANYTGLLTQEDREVFNQNVLLALTELDEPIITELLARYWREQLTGSWFCGLKKWQHFGPQIGELLLASKTCYAGQGYSFALACFANDNSVEYLTRYLDKYLPQIDLYYDQHWAMPALMWVDEQLGTTHSYRFLVQDGLWERFVADKVKIVESWQLDVCKENFFRAMRYCQANFMTA